MRKQTAIVSAAALLLFGVTTASAATALRGTDTVILSATQRGAVWNDLSKRATNQSVARFDATTGTFVPNAVRMKIQPIPSKVTANNPSLQPYDFAMVDHKVVIVDPTNYVIADVLTPPATGRAAIRRQCVGIRHGLTECRTIHMSAKSKATS
jgi:Protein of unknown function (DUF1236)